MTMGEHRVAGMSDALAARYKSRRPSTEGYTAIIAPPDEEGFSIVAIVAANDGDGDSQVFDRFSIRSDQVDQWVAQELAILNSPNGPRGACEHGLSAALCSGPQHY